jgi:hypothetical protein
VVFFAQRRKKFGLTILFAIPSPPYRFDPLERFLGGNEIRTSGHDQPQVLDRAVDLTETQERLG